MTASPATDPSDIPGSLALLAATALALVVANTALAPLYKAVLGAPLSLGVGSLAIEDSVKDWIKNALMAVFFLYVGLEIKYEFAAGALATRERAVLPFIAAAGGIVVPALLYLVLAGRDPALRAGWAIPSATDIAFAVGVVGLLGRHVPATLKAFLLAVAVIDDLAAILIIAVFYTGGLSLWPLLISVAGIGGLALLNQRGEARLAPYLGVGLLLWLALKQGGINPTLAGVVVALFIPLRGPGGTEPLHHLAHRLKGAVTFAIMPIFAFANAGVSFQGLGPETLAGPVALGVGLGLALGKPVGITLAVWLGVRSGHAALPAGASWQQIVGIGALAGIGFTMSLFIADLAFGGGKLMEQARIGVLAGSLIATALGAALLVTAGKARP
jgi:NhaA family Na+:H+ antiporter